MVDITSLKARLARLRLGSEFEDKNPELADPVTIERKKKKQKKAAQDPYNEYTKNTNKRKKNNKLTRSDQKRGSLDAGDGDYTKNTGGKRKKKNKLTRSDQKRGKKTKGLGYDPNDPAIIAERHQSKPPMTEKQYATFRRKRKRDKAE